MAEETVDVLIIGAGAAGAAFAWSLADTRMNILCLEQGDWWEGTAGCKLVSYFSLWDDRPMFASATNVSCETLLSSGRAAS